MKMDENRHYTMSTLEKFTGIHIGNPDISQTYVKVCSEVPPSRALIHHLHPPIDELNLHAHIVHGGVYSPIRLIPQVAMKLDSLIGTAERVFEKPRQSRSDAASDVTAGDTTAVKDMSISELMALPHTERPMPNVVHWAGVLRDKYPCVFLKGLTMKHMIDVALYASHHEYSNELLERSYIVLCVVEAPSDEPPPWFICLSGFIQHLSAADVATLEETRRSKGVQTGSFKTGETIDKAAMTVPTGSQRGRRLMPGDMFCPSASSSLDLQRRYHYSRRARRSSSIEEPTSSSKIVDGNVEAGDMFVLSVHKEESPDSNRLRARPAVITIPNDVFERSAAAAEELSKAVELPASQRGLREMGAVANLLRDRCKFLRSMEDNAFQMVCKTFYLRHFRPGEIVCLQGETGDVFYLILRGDYPPPLSMHACIRSCVRSLVRSFVHAFMHSFVKSLHWILSGQCVHRRR